MAKIIIIDDEPAMVEVIVTLCRDKGHQVFPFNSAPKAVEQLDTIQPQVVITDIKMETMSGFDVLRHVRENHRQTSVILITAYASVDTAIEAMKMGAYGYVPKPFKIDELQNAIGLQLNQQSRGHRQHRANHRRKRDREGIGRARITLQQQSAASPIRGDQLQRASGKFARIRVVRSQKGCFYWRGLGQARAFRRSEPRHDFPRRSEFDGAAVADEATARFAGARGSSSGRQQKRSRKRARGRRDQRAASGKDQGWFLPGRSLLPPGRYSGRDSTVTRALGGCSASSESLLAKASERDRRRAEKNRSASS